MGNIQSEIDKATRKITNIDYRGVTKHQAIFIALYCQEASDQNNSFYCLINKFMRERNEQLVCIRSALYLLESGLRSLPSNEGGTWRGMNSQPDLDKFVVGQTVCFSGICSTSTDKDQALRFMEVTPRTGIHKRTLFKLDMLNGVSIEKWSAYEQEQEVVASFCSRWTVITVKEDHNEFFDSIGSYRCDYYIELRQLPSEPLFRSNVVLTGLHLLSQVDYEKSTDVKTNFKVKVLDFFNQLTDVTAQKILELVFLSTNYWNEEDNSFENNSENEEIFDIITQFLAGVRTLSIEFQHHDIDLRKGFEICETHRIYSAVHLLFDKENDTERTVADFERLGFDTECATNLYNQESVKRELESLYKRFNYGDALKSSRNVSIWLSYSSLKHYIMKDGVMVHIYELARISVEGTKDLSPKLRNLFNRTTYFDVFKIAKILDAGIVYSNFVMPHVLFTLQFGMYSVRLWYGDITTHQFLKTIATCAVSISAGIVGSATAGFFAASCAAVLGLIGWPAILLVMTGSAVGGLILHDSADNLCRYLLEHFFPYDETDELNAQRKLYCAALEILGCTPDSTMKNIQNAYYRKAQVTHPDKCDNKEVAEEEFKRIMAAYEIAKTYHEVLEGACKTLNIPNNFTMDHVKACKGFATNNDETKRAYNIVYRHVVYNINKWERIRNWLDSDQNLKLRDPAPAAIEQS